MDEIPKTQLSAGRWTLPFLGMACGVGVASIYYNQPLLLVIGESLHQNARAMGFVAVATQVGYAAGILTFVPMGDTSDRRNLMVRMYACVAAALALAGMAQNLLTIVVASVIIGLLASVTHIALPMAPELVPSERRGQAIGTVMTGLLMGVLLARTFAGWIARASNWRTVYFAAAVMNAMFVPLIYKAMPRMAPRQTLSYSAALRSLWTLFRDEPLLLESGLVGGIVFAAFSAFWTTLTFMLAKHYGMGPGVAGTFGAVGAAGALVAPLAGRVSDKLGTRRVIGVAGAIVTACYGWLLLADKLPGGVALHMFFLVLGILGLDVGMQMTQVGNQTRIFGLDESARSRINTIYMTMYFVGGATGSALGSLAWGHWGWTGVCVMQMSLLALAGVIHATGYSRSNAVRERHLPVNEQEPA